MRLLSAMPFKSFRYMSSRYAVRRYGVVQKLGGFADFFDNMTGSGWYQAANHNVLFKPHKPIDFTHSGSFR
jgi:hypothetical protein